MASLLAPAGFPGGRWLGNIHGGEAPAKVGGAAALGQMIEVDEVSTPPVVTSTATAPKGFGFVRRAVDAIVRSPSLMVLAAAALPGLAGLIAVTFFGVRVGYCQAKVGLALRACGLARYAPLGPLGIVRTGSFIAVHSRSAPRRRLEDAA